jgi:hypothetical protein
VRDLRDSCASRELRSILFPRLRYKLLYKIARVSVRRD